MDKKKLIANKKEQSLDVKNNADKLFSKICLLVENSKANIAATVNSELTVLYWQIGHLIHHDILQLKRADYGEQIVATLSQLLTEQYGKGFNYSALTRMRNFSTLFPSSKIVATMSQQLSWSHFIELISIKSTLQREFYIEMCKMERWSVRQLRERIDSMLFERTAISKKPGALIKKELNALRNKEAISEDLVFRDPYLLDFLGLKDTYSEKDLESAIIAELQRFITELGSDFAFLARQKRIIIDNVDYYIDLLFYHRKLRRLVAIDLKLGKFKPADKAQMELYLNWLAKHERVEAEELPIGLILCADKSDEHIELLTLNKGNIRVAQYFTELPSKKLLEQKLHKAFALAKAKFDTIPKLNDGK